MKAFFEPRSVAVIGASTRPGKLGHEVLKSMIAEFRGCVYAVNPKAKEILGVPCYPSVSEIPDEVDLAVIVLPAPIVPRIVEECGRKGVRAVVVISGGFAEAGNPDLQQQLVETARHYGVRVIGPNCIGVFDGHTRVCSFFQPRERCLRPPPGKVAYITQSGTFGLTVLEWFAESGVGVSRFASFGNAADVTEADLIEWFAEDPQTEIVAAYLEGVSDGRRLFEAVQRAAERKPVVILKAGRTQAGSSAAKSHTGRLAGEYRVFEAALRQAGAFIVQTIEQLFDVVKALAFQPWARGERVIMVTNGAGPCVMAADKLDELGVQLPVPSEELTDKLKNALPGFCQVEQNPIDLTGSANAALYESALNLVAESGEYDVLMPFFVFQNAPLEERIVDVIAELKKYKLPIVCGAAGGAYTKEMAKRLEQHRIPVYPTPERAAYAAYALIWAGRRYQQT